MPVLRSAAMRRLIFLAFAACGSGHATSDAGIGDGALCDCILPDAADEIDAAPQPAGAHVFQVDLSDETTSPTGNWVIVGFDTLDTLITGIPDFATGQATTVTLQTGLWTVSEGNANNWTAGNVDWLPAIVAQDDVAGSAIATLPSTIRFAKLDGRYKVEVVVAHYNTSAPARVAVNGATTTTTHKGAAGKDSASWSPLNDGAMAGDWLEWADVAPQSGVILIEVLPGHANAVRLSPP